MSKKSKKELAKAEALMAKALKVQAKAKKMKDEAARMQLAMLQAANGAASVRPEAVAMAAPTPEPVMQFAGTAPVNIVPQSAPEADANSGQPADPVRQIRHHIGRNRFLYAAIGTVIILTAIYLGYAVSKRGAQAAAADAPAVSEAGATAERAAPPAESGQVPTTVTVLDTWEMPKELIEISSNAFIDADRIACVEDNDGVIYTYNLKTRKFEAPLRFGGQGDYEALSVVGNAFYVLRADGMLYEVQPAASGKPAVKTYDLPLNVENDTEPMFYDEPNNRLLVGVKETDPTSSEYKGVYSFDLRTKTMELKPVMTIPAEHEGAAAGGTSKKKNKARTIKPSEIAIDPKSGDLYVLNGPQAEFLIVGKDGALRQAIQLDKNVFPQPEGMCFSPAGELYISSEGGKKGVGVIAKVGLK